MDSTRGMTPLDIGDHTQIDQYLGKSIAGTIISPKVSLNSVLSMSKKRHTPDFNIKNRSFGVTPKLKFKPIQNKKKHNFQRRSFDSRKIKSGSNSPGSQDFKIVKGGYTNLSKRDQQKMLNGIYYFQYLF